MVGGDDGAGRVRVSVLKLAQGLRPEELDNLVGWLRELSAICSSGRSVQRRYLAAVGATIRYRVIWPIVRELQWVLPRELAATQSWRLRLGLGGALVAATVMRGQALGLAGFGTAVAVPAWLVIGAGASFVGALIDDVERLRALLKQRSAAPITVSSRQNAWALFRLDLMQGDSRTTLTSAAEEVSGTVPFLCLGPRLEPAIPATEGDPPSLPSDDPRPS